MASSQIIKKYCFVFQNSYTFQGDVQVNKPHKTLEIALIIFCS